MRGYPGSRPRWFMSGGSMSGRSPLPPAPSITPTAPAMNNQG